jgi:hypothetical protein
MSGQLKLNEGGKGGAPGTDQEVEVRLIQKAQVRVN